MHNVKRPMIYDLFRQLDAESQNEYLSFLATTFGASIGDIATMLGCNKSTLYRVTKGLSCASLFKRGRYMNSAQRVNWELFCQGKFFQNEEQNDGKPVEPKTIPVVVAIHPAAIKTAMQRFSLSFAGDIDLTAVAEQLRSLIGDSHVSRLEISCEL